MSNEIEKVARICGWTRHPVEDAWVNGERPYFIATLNGSLTADGLGVIEDRLLRAGWTLAWDKDFYVWDKGEDGFIGRTREECAIRTFIAAFDTTETR